MFDGHDILKASERQLSEIRGREIAMIFQNPRGSLNPIRTVGDQIADVLKRHSDVARKADARQGHIGTFGCAHPRPGAMRANAYPYELSGGMCQRIGSRWRMSCTPTFLIADEPTTGLDVTTQATIMDLITDLVRAGRYSRPY